MDSFCGMSYLLKTEILYLTLSGGLYLGRVEDIFIYLLHSNGWRSIESIQKQNLH